MRAASTVTDGIRSAILRGRYAPRQRLVEVDLCEEFGASRFTVRQALQELTVQGLVEFQPNKGARVRAVSPAEAAEITEVRGLLEGLQAHHAALARTPEAATQLGEFLAQLRAAADRGDVVTFSEVSARIENVVRDLAAHETSARLLRQLRDQTVRHRFTAALLPDWPERALPHLEALVAGVVDGDAAAARAAAHGLTAAGAGALREVAEF